MQANLILAALIAIILPQSLWQDWLSLSETGAQLMQVSIVQFVAMFGIVSVVRRSESRSQKLFWLFVFFGLINISLYSLTLLTEFSAAQSLLNRDFALLLFYLFTLLAIETNPHFSSTPHHRYTFGRIPAVLFTVFCFVYFVIIPAQFSTTSYTESQLSVLFMLPIDALLLIRIGYNFLHTTMPYWRRCYLALAAAVTCLLVFDLSLFLGSDIDGNNGTTVSLAAYFFLLLAALQTGHSEIVAKSTYFRSRIEVYVAALIMSGITLHSIQYFVIGPDERTAKLQVFTFILFLVASFGFLVFINNRRNNQMSSAFEKLKQQHQELEETDSQVRHLTSSLLNSEEKAIVKSSSNAILTTTVTGEILSANPAALHVFQYLEKELIGKNVSELFAEDDEMKQFFNFESNLFSLQRSEDGLSKECLSTRSDNRTFPVQAELQWAERQDSPLIVITFINLTSIKLAEQQALELKDNFIANISHEFRTPLTIINGVIEQHLNSTVDSQTRSDLSMAKRNGLRLVHMVEQMLELSRLADSPKLSMNGYKLASLMAMPIESFAQLSAQNGLTFSAELDEESWIECDAQGFEKIVFNLLANAVKYTPKGGSINVTSHRVEGAIVLSVSDTGVGIAKAYQDKIFHRFERTDDAANSAAFGVGIGLSLVSELVKAHGWRIQVVSNEGQGTRFSLTMPLSEPQESSQSIPISLSQSEVGALILGEEITESQAAKHAQKVVLVIEDNPDMQIYIKRIIERQHHCIVASSGEQGLELAEAYIPDIVVCDLMLPGIDGYEVLNTLKTRDLTAHIPVVLLTARAGLEAKLEGLNLKADEYLSKPFNQHELLLRIQNLIDVRQKLQSIYREKLQVERQADRKDIVQENAAGLDKSALTPSANDKFLQRLEAVMAKHYRDTSLDIAFIASELAVSERQLQRKMNSLLGVSPNNFIKEFRLRQAVLLLNSGNQIGQIALEVGFSSQAYFGHCFKETYECTPKQYQKKIQSDE